MRMPCDDFHRLYQFRFDRAIEKFQKKRFKLNELPRKYHQLHRIKQFIRGKFLAMLCLQLHELYNISLFVRRLFFYFLFVCCSHSNQKYHHFNLKGIWRIYRVNFFFHLFSPLFYGVSLHACVASELLSTVMDVASEYLHFISVNVSLEIVSFFRDKIKG